MSDLHLDPTADDQQLLARVVGHYQQALKTRPEPQQYLSARGLTNPDLIDEFRIGFSDRSLGTLLPPKAVQSGERIRARLRSLGLFRASGHEHFRGSITIPISAADGSNRIVNIYGRKLRDDLRAGTARHTNLDDRHPGVWNVSAFGRTKEVVLCSSIWDGLTLWQHGYRNCTTMFGDREHNLTPDLLDAFAEFRIKRVLTCCPAVVPKLLAAGLDVFTVRLPLNSDLNRYALQTTDPVTALGDLLRSAEWQGRGIGPVSVNGSQAAENGKRSTETENEPADNIHFLPTRQVERSCGKEVCGKEARVIPTEGRETPREKEICGKEVPPGGAEPTSFPHEAFPHDDLPNGKPETSFPHGTFPRVPSPQKSFATTSSFSPSHVGEGEVIDREPPAVPVLTASPLPPLAAGPEVRITPTEVLLLVGNRTYRVRGLERNAGIDTLKVNLLVSNSVGSYLDTLDLYAAKPRAGFIEQAAGELRIEQATVKKELGRLLLELEKVQDDRLRVNQPANALPEMTHAEQDAALRLLLDPLLLDRIANDISVVGERTNKLAAFLAVVSRKLDQPLAVVVQSTSAAGKSTLVDAVLDLCPPEDVVRFSAMTGQSLYYLADGSLRHKVLAIAEEEGASRAAYALKLLQSDGQLTIASTGKDAGTGRLTTQTYTVCGPVSLVTTTTSTTVDEELLNRCLVLSVDEDRQQTRAIHDRQRRRQTLDGLLEAEARQAVVQVHRNAQRLLRPLRVVNPFAEKLSFPVSATRTRRDHAKYLTLIRAITLLFQHQRPVRTTTVNGKPVEFIETTARDIAVANELAHEVLGRSLDELPQTRNLLTLLAEFVATNAREQGIDKDDVRFTRREVRDAVGWGPSQLALHLKRLEDLEFLTRFRDRATGRTTYALHAVTIADRRTLPGLVDPTRLTE